MFNKLVIKNFIAYCLKALWSTEWYKSTLQKRSALICYFHMAYELEHQWTYIMKDYNPEKERVINTKWGPEHSTLRSDIVCLPLLKPLWLMSKWHEPRPDKMYTQQTPDFFHNDRQREIYTHAHKFRTMSDQTHRHQALMVLQTWNHTQWEPHIMVKG